MRVTHGLYADLKGLLSFFSPSKATLLSALNDGCHDGTKITDEPPIKESNTMKGPNLCGVGKDMPSPNGFYFCGFNLYTFLTYNES